MSDYVVAFDSSKVSDYLEAAVLAGVLPATITLDKENDGDTPAKIKAKAQAQVDSAKEAHKRF